ncbi:FAD-dependent monooxygenase [Nocardia callitridis]|uniref:FAD-dependent monooxygenase n=1 Tax=Nocardia callitridis TaxID=648753 RepID=A0ABP9JRN2_9NOCA
MPIRTVLISGASVAGPALAYWLRRYGYAVTVVERAPALRPGGQAIDFTGRTQFTVLERMGIRTDIEQRRTGTTDIRFVDDNGTRLAELTGEFTGGDVEILRGDLAKVMYDHTAATCEYRFGDSISALTETDDGVLVEFENGPERTFDLVFGADGIHSRVRKLAFGPEHEFVEHRGWYYCVAGANPWSAIAHGERERAIAYGYNTPGRLAVSGGSKAQQLYMFAAPELDYARDDQAALRRIVTDAYSDAGWEVPRMLRELAEFDDIYLDSLSRVTMRDGYTRGRVALVGDSAYGSTLNGFGTGFALVGAYVIAGELARAEGDHTVAFARYDAIMRGYTKIAGNSDAGRFLAPKTALGIRVRNWFLHSWAFRLMQKYAERAREDIELLDYPALVTGSHTS